MWSSPSCCTWARSGGLGKVAKPLSHHSCLRLQTHSYLEHGPVTASPLLSSPTEDRSSLSLASFSLNTHCSHNTHLAHQVRSELSASIHTAPCFNCPTEHVSSCSRQLPSLTALTHRCLRQFITETAAEKSLDITSMRISNVYLMMLPNANDRPAYLNANGQPNRKL